MTAPWTASDSTAAICDATVMLLDDRWGAVKARCELQPGHDGQHLHLMGATVPTAYLRWST